MTDLITKPQICIVCIANYCRSPVAHKILEAKFSDKFRITSAGLNPLMTTSMDDRSKLFLQTMGFKSLNHIPRKFTKDVFDASSLILAMDMHVLMGINKFIGRISDKVKLFTYQSKSQQIIDPYKLDKDSYDLVMKNIFDVSNEIDFKS